MSEALSAQKKGDDKAMASIEKHGADTLYFIRHNMRKLPPKKTPSNIEIDPNRTKDNYSIISRGNTAEKVNEYRKQIEGEIFHYNRKNLVRSVEVVITLPTDCPSEQEKAFFKEAYNYVVSTLPMGEKCVFLAEVHKDEGRVQKDGVTVIEAPPHMHIMYVPGVKDEKHDGYDFKLCADQLTKRAQLKQFHPKFQKWLDDAGINATVHSGVTGGQNVSVSKLKQLTKETGLTLAEVKDLQVQLKAKEQKNEQLRNRANQIIKEKNRQIETLTMAASDKEKALSEVSEKLAEKEQALSEASQHQQELQAKVRSLEAQLKTKEEELQKERQKTQEAIAQRTEKPSEERTWGDTGAWGRTDGWGNHDITKERTADRLW